MTKPELWGLYFHFFSLMIRVKGGNRQWLFLGRLGDKVLLLHPGGYEQLTNNYYFKK